MYVRRVVVTFKEGFVSYTVKWFRIFCLLMFLNGKSSFVTEGLTISWTIFGTTTIFFQFSQLWKQNSICLLTLEFSILVKSRKSCEFWRFFVHCDIFLSIVCERIVCLFQGFFNILTQILKVQKIRIIAKSILNSWFRKVSWEF